MRRLLTLLACCATVLVLRAAAPDYLRAALSRYHPEPPAGWAYTLSTTRDGETSSERFDPARRKGGEWTLLTTQGRAATADEIERYLRYRTSTAPATSRATFERGDLDVETAELVREDAERAEFRLRFRDGASQPLLAHVVLELTVRKAPLAVEQSVLRLISPFSPALGVRMHELVVTTTHASPTVDTPALPREVVSHFRGRIFFLIPLEEDLRVVYSDFAPSGAKGK